MYNKTLAADFQNLDIQEKKFSPKRPELLGQTEFYGASASVGGAGVQGRPSFADSRLADNFSDDDCEETSSIAVSSNSCYELECCFETRI